MSTQQGFGQQEPSDTSSHYNAVAFVVKQMLARVRTAQLVQVISCSNSGGVAAVGTVVVQPLVNMLDGNGNSQAHGQIFNVPYFRLQGGPNGAIICDPAAGDIGLLAICDRDISAVQQNKAPSDPGSLRQHDFADGLYIGGFLSAVPKAYVQFDGQGNINIVDANGNKIQTSSNGIAITGNVTVTGTIAATSNITANSGGGSSVDLLNHTHSGITTGTSNSGPPNAGT